MPKPSEPLTRRAAMKRIGSTLDRLPSDDDRRAVIDAAISLYQYVEPRDGVERGDAGANTPSTARRA